MSGEVENVEPLRHNYIACEIRSGNGMLVRKAEPLGKTRGRLKIIKGWEMRASSTTYRKLLGKECDVRRAPMYRNPKRRVSAGRYHVQVPRSTRCAILTLS